MSNRYFETKRRGPGYSTALRLNIGQNSEIYVRRK